MGQSRWETRTVAINTAVSDAIALAFGERIVGIQTPDTWTAADIVPQISRDGGTTYVDVMNRTGTLMRLTNIATGAVEFRSLVNDVNGVDLPAGPQHMRLRSVNTATAADVNQAAARSIEVLIARD